MSSTLNLFSNLQIKRDIKHLNNFDSFIIMKSKKRCKCNISGVQKQCRVE